MNKVTLDILRVSGDDQETASQRDTILAESNKRGLTRVDMETYQKHRTFYDSQPDVAVWCELRGSAWDDDRKVFSWIDGMVKGGWVKAVIAYDTTRIGRSVVGNLRFAELCKSRATELFLCKEQFDLLSPAGKLQFTILSGMAEYSSAMTSQKVKDALRHRRDTCLNCGVHLREHGRKGCRRFEHTPHSGGLRGRVSDKVRRELKRMKKYIDAGDSNYEISRGLGLDYRTVVKYRKRFAQGWQGPERK